eukprot:765104-Hanusia_phi.AAC.5
MGQRERKRARQAYERAADELHGMGIEVSVKVHVEELRPCKQLQHVRGQKVPVDDQDRSPRCAASEKLPSHSHGAYDDTDCKQSLLQESLSRSLTFTSLVLLEVLLCCLQLLSKVLSLRQDAQTRSACPCLTCLFMHTLDTHLHAVSEDHARTRHG